MATNSLSTLSTEQLIKKCSEAGININEEESRKFRDYHVDGETVNLGLTESMVGHLFDGSFKKQLQFRQFVTAHQHKEGLVQEPVNSNSTEEHQPQPFTDPSSEVTRNRIPLGIGIPKFPRDVQSKLDAGGVGPCAQKLRNNIIRGLYEMVAEYTLYPTNAEYTQVVKALVVKYPFLRDVTGNGYHTWHMSLKRKFKAERAPLVNDCEVRKVKEKFGNKKQSESTTASAGSAQMLRGRMSASLTDEIGVGEDSSTIEAHVNVLQNEYLKTQPDMSTVHDRMVRTFPWRRREIMEGMTVEDVLIKYPHLRMPAELFNEVDRIHQSQKGFGDRFREGFANVLTNVLQLAKGKSPIAKQYNETRQDALAEDVPGIDFRAGLILLPLIFKEKVEHFITMGEGNPATPYPTIRLLDNDWKMAIAGRALNVVKVDGVDVCQCTGIEDGFITAFSMHFVFNIAYPLHLKNTLTFLQRRIVSIVEEGEKTLPVTVLRVINLLC